MTDFNKPLWRLAVAIYAQVLDRRRPRAAAGSAGRRLAERANGSPARSAGPSFAAGGWPPKGCGTSCGTRCRRSNTRWRNSSRSSLTHRIQLPGPPRSPTSIGTSWRLAELFDEVNFDQPTKSAVRHHRADRAGRRVLGAV